MAENKVVAWFDKHGTALQGVGSILTILIAAGALIGVKVQIDAAARIQQEQSARDIYREFLNLSISKPEFTDPDYCAIKDGPQEAAYQNYVEYLLYAAEQMLAVSPEWEQALEPQLGAHSQYICSVSDWSGYPDRVEQLVSQVKAKSCTKAVTACSPTAP